MSIDSTSVAIKHISVNFCVWIEATTLFWKFEDLGTSKLCFLGYEKSIGLNINRLENDTIAIIMSGHYIQRSKLILIIIATLKGSLKFG